MSMNFDMLDMLIDAYHSKYGRTPTVAKVATSDYERLRIQAIQRFSVHQTALATALSSYRGVTIEADDSLLPDDFQLEGRT